MSFVRLRPGVQLDDVNTRIEKLAEQVRKSDDVFISLVPIKDYRMEFGISTMRMVWILLTLGTAILFIVAMNYVLISISAMNRRAKAIGVYINVVGQIRELFSVCSYGRPESSCFLPCCS